MKVRALLNTLLAAVVAAELAAIITLQVRIAGLRGERESLAPLAAEARQLEADLRTLDALRSQREEATSLRDSNRELPGLRNQIRQLRDQAREARDLERAQAARGAQPSGGAAPDAGQIRRIGRTIRMEDVRFQGYSTPEATVESLLYGMMTTNQTILAGALSAKAYAEVMKQVAENGWADLNREVRDFSGMELVAAKDTADGATSIGVRMRKRNNATGEESSDESSLPLERTDDGWKIAFDPD